MKMYLKQQTFILREVSTINFPDDWIAPGEFKYCNCGIYLIEKCYKCYKCSSVVRDLNKIAKMEQEHLILSLKRLLLATKRKNQGIKPCQLLTKLPLKN